MAVQDQLKPRRLGFAPVSRVRVRTEQRRAAWLMEDIGATLTTIAILGGIVIVRLVALA